mgnify:CR=1 FL=1
MAHFAQLDENNIVINVICVDDKDVTTPQAWWDPFKILTAKEILDLEPNLKPVFSGGCFYDYAYHAKDPQGITKKMLMKKLFLATPTTRVLTRPTSLEIVSETVVN